jgi:hypothetical protein
LADLLGALDFDSPTDSDSEDTRPTVSEIAEIFVRLANINTEYHWYRGNCFWFAGSVWESLKYQASVTRTSPYYDSKGKFAGIRVGSDYNVSSFAFTV